MDIQWDVTSVRQFNDVLTVVPNTVISNSEIINYTHPQPEFQATIDIGVSYKSDLERVEQVTLEETEAIMHSMAGHDSSAGEPFIRYRGFDSSNIIFRLYMPAHRIDEQILLKHRVVKQLHERYRQEGITISYQTVTIDNLAAEGPAQTPESHVDEASPTDRLDEHHDR